MSTEPEVDYREGYAEKYGFHDTEQHVFKMRKGLNPAIVSEISKHKGEPEWMTWATAPRPGSTNWG